jgi:putative transposase
MCDRWFPSTRTCSRCGTVKRPMPLAERTFRCGSCGLVAERDRNAAANLAAWAETAGAAANTPGRQGGWRSSSSSPLLNAL